MIYCRIQVLNWDIPPKGPFGILILLPLSSQQEREKRMPFAMANSLPNENIDQRE